MASLAFIPAAALSDSMPETLAVIVNNGPFQGVVQALQNLHMQHTGRVYIVNDPMGESTASILERTTALHLPCLVLCDREPLPQDLPTSATPSVSLISDRPYMPVLQFADAVPGAYISWIGYQTYFCPPTLLRHLSQTHADLLRLGTLRRDKTEAEPLLREARYHFVDMRALRACDAPDGLSPQPNGLYAEELCQLTRYIGLCQELKAAFFYGFPTDRTAGSLITEVTAEAVWHLLEALAAGTPEHPSLPTLNADLQRKIVPLGEDGQEIIFWNSTQTGRWWLEIADCSHPNHPQFIACSSSDYATACRGEVPLKWLKYYQFYNNL